MSTSDTLPVSPPRLSQGAVPPPPPSTPPRPTRALLAEPQPKSTPVAFKSSGHHPHANLVKKQEDQNMELSKEMEDHFVGPMDPQAFLDEFLPLTKEAKAKAKANKRPIDAHAFISVYSTKMKDERTMYGPFVRAVTPFAPGITFRDTHSIPDMDADRLSSDVSGYRNDNLPDDLSPGSKTDFSKMSIFVEFKFKLEHDPFNDAATGDKVLFERKAVEHMKRRGQIASYTAAISGSQFRVHVFSVSICANTARFIRWDRCGAVVSKHFNYIEQPRLLADFFWRYAHLGARQQGYDPTVSTPSDAEKMAAREAFEAKRKLGREDQDFRKIMVPSIKNPKVEKAFIVPFPPQYRTRSPFSRATRPMLAFDLEEKEIVFMKDYWRPDVADIEKEGVVYGILHTHNVPNIAPFGTGNDVRDHVTRTQEFVNKDWARRRRAPGKEAIVLTPLRQYRMTLLVVGEPLIDFKSSKQFVTAIADAMKAHDGAYFRARILHRDISVGNIIIFGEGGLLIDWDMCAKVDPKRIAPRRPKRTGTWQFMSAKLLKPPKQNYFHDIEDDRESALWVMLWTALRYTKHSESIESEGGVTVNDLLAAFDEARPDGSGGVTGGTLKSSFLTTDTQLTFDDRPQFDALITELRETFAYRYVVKLKRRKGQAAVDEMYQEGLQNLRSENWLVETMQQFLGADGWPSDDKAEPQETVILESTAQKQTLDQANISERVEKMFRHLTTC